MKDYFFREVKINLFLCFVLVVGNLLGQDSTVSNSFIIESQVYPNWNNDEYKPALKLRLVLQTLTQVIFF